MNLIRAFIAGSSFPVTIWPFLYLGLSFHFHPSSDFSMGLVPLMMPIILGVWNMVWISTNPWKNKKNSALVYGAVLGLLLSIAGNLSRLPTELFQLSESLQYTTIPFAIIAYALIFRYIVLPLNKILKIKF